MTNEIRTLVQKLCAWAVVVLSLLAACYGICRLAWWLTLQITPNVARLWALSVTAALPVSVWVTWRLALRYAAGVVDGIDAGISKVAQAGNNAANLRVHVHRELRQQPEPVIAVLPPVRIAKRELASGRQVIDL